MISLQMVKNPETVSGGGGVGGAAEGEARATFTVDNKFSRLKQTLSHSLQQAHESVVAGELVVLNHEPQPLEKQIWDDSHLAMFFLPFIQVTKLSPKKHFASSDHNSRLQANRKGDSSNLFLQLLSPSSPVIVNQGESSLTAM